MGLHSDHQTGTSYGQRGQTKFIPGLAQQFRGNVLSTVTNPGHLAFTLFKEALTVPVFLRFLRRLLRQHRRPVFLILDRHPVRRARMVPREVATWALRLWAFILPVTGRSWIRRVPEPGREEQHPRAGAAAAPSRDGQDNARVPPESAAPPGLGPPLLPSGISALCGLAVDVTCKVLPGIVASQSDLSRYCRGFVI